MPGSLTLAQGMGTLLSAPYTRRTQLSSSTRQRSLAKTSILLAIAIGPAVPNVLVRDIRPETLAALKIRARQHLRSLQQELAALLEEAAQQAAQPSRDEIAAAIRARLGRSGRVFTDSTVLIREARER